MSVEGHPLYPLLVKLEACEEALRWSCNRVVTRATFEACPSGEWIEWLAAELGCDGGDYDGMLAALGSGSGYGDGYGAGYGYGDGYG